MDISSHNGLTPSMYTQVVALSSESKTAGSIVKNTESRQSTSSSSYSVSLSSDGLAQSKAYFEAKQNRDKQSFERELDREEKTKTREMASEKRQFEQKQATKQQQFESSQRIEEIKFLNQQNA
jgi:hypothetical protein